MLNQSQVFSFPILLDEFIFQEIGQNAAVASVAAEKKNTRKNQSIRAKKTLRSILFMDDENSLRILVSLMLERLGYRVTTAAHGSQALSLYESRINSTSPFDVVILDINIENGMDGIETIQKLLVIDPDAKAIGASGSITPENLKELLQIGFKCVLAKPFRIQQLQAALNQILKGVDQK